MSDDAPAHVAIIMDGNGRWAKLRKLPRTAGHRQGIITAQKIIKASGKAGIKDLTLFVFSSENWQRPEAEVSALMNLFIESLQNEVQGLVENGVCLNFLGDKGGFSKELYQQIQQAEKLTLANSKLLLNIAVNYGGKLDILHAVKKIVRDVQQGSLKVEDIDEEILRERLSTGGIPAPDLLIRTGGERRISNFLLWQLAYTELYFCDVLWPDFNQHELTKAFESYRLRQRRFGRTQEQVSP